MTEAVQPSSAGSDRALLATLVHDAMRFAIWAAGQGIMPDEGEPARGPEDFLYEYSCAMDVDDWEGLAEVARDALIDPAQAAGMREALIAAGCTTSDGTYVHVAMYDVLRALAAQPPAAPVEDGVSYEAIDAALAMGRPGIERMVDAIAKETGAKVAQCSSAERDREGELDFSVPTTNRIMGAVRLHTHDHTMAYNITRDILAVLGKPQPTAGGVCCYCDAPLCCAACGREQPDDSADLPQEALKPVAWRYQRKEGWGNLWRLSEIDPTQHEGFFETPDSWTVQPLYALPRPKLGGGS